MNRPKSALIWEPEGRSAMAAPVLISFLSRPEIRKVKKQKFTFVTLSSGVGSSHCWQDRERGFGDRGSGIALPEGQLNPFTMAKQRAAGGKWVFAGKGWTNSCQIVRIALAKVNRDECIPLTHIHGSSDEDVQKPTLTESPEPKPDSNSTTAPRTSCGDWDWELSMLRWCCHFDFRQRTTLCPGCSGGSLGCCWTRGNKLWYFYFPALLSPFKS